jgi:alkylation response protein AidB-like acyl-CoA dehydrogenase
VDFELSPDQMGLREAAADLLDGLSSPEQLRAFVGPGTGREDDVAGLEDGFDRELWKAMAEQGWLAVERPESEDGLGLGMVEVVVLCEELGRHAAPAPFVGSVLCLDALGEAAADGSLNPDVRDAVGRWTSQLATGEIIGCVGWSADPTAISARRDGESWFLIGRPEPTLYASVAGVAVVATEDALFAVELTDEGRPSAEPAMDPTRPLAWLRFDETRAVRIGGADQASHLLDRAATANAGLLLGSSERALDLSVEYAKVRKQFGKPIGSFQAVKHRLADALVDVEGMRSSAYYAAWCLATDQEEAPLAASLAKAWCSDASRRVTAAGLQVHGGIGFTWEQELHLHVKRAQLDAASFGDASWHRNRIAGILQQGLAEGRAPI